MPFGFRTYTTELGGQLSRVNVDLSWKEDGADLDRPWAVWVRVAVREGETPELATGASLDDLRDALDAALFRSHGAVFVGSRVRGVRADLLFYTTRCEGVDDAVRGEVPDLVAATVEIRADADWGLYHRALYPEPRIEADMRHRDALRQMSRLGDPIGVSRPIVHHLEFPDEAGARSAAARLGEEGFIAERKGSRVEVTEDRPLDEAFLESASAVFALTEACGGVYAGWDAERRRASAPTP
jgi:hypothetical protein